MSTTHATLSPELDQQPFERQMCNLGKTTSVKPWWNHGETLVEPSTEAFGSPRQICPRKPERVRKQFCPETFAMAEDPKAIAVGEKEHMLPELFENVQKNLPRGSGCLKVFIETSNGLPFCMG